MTSKINLLWKAISKKLDDTPIRDTAGNPAAQVNFTSTNDTTREDLREQSRNPSSPKYVHFINSIVILNKEDEAKEKGNVKTSTTEYGDHEMTVESKEELEEETKDEIKEEEEDSPKHFDTFPTIKELRYGLKRLKPIISYHNTRELHIKEFHLGGFHLDVQAFYAKESPISSPDPITSPAILTPSPHEEQIEDILNYLDELYLHRIERMEEGRINGNELKTELKEIHTQIIKLQKKRLGQKDKIAFAHYRISDLEQIIEKIQARHQTNQEDL
ncbi:hypothetical protein Tco_0811008 [Tanacetum coccineum]